MIDSMPPAEVANAERFERFGLEADAMTVAQIRHEFALWLQRFFDLDAVRCSDIVLAINEALANSAEFAYLLAERPGTIDLQGIFEPTEQKLTVLVSDRGTWRPPQTDPAPRTRGRGIPLMEALSDEYEIDRSDDGTRVRMVWHGVGRR
ncbi:anti-sigma regulatory factor [Mycolicibacterium duvalii]|uniref:Anti-sigma regulatory factor n=2 Tax=Mycolicibacterium duvalii TaxID=39688 RepID=A0A7I7JX05_9MYCO|nr:ATP-binding protein [Mycolicibacterium duvalii]MCV7369618.1 ATP-binding protein [Mycolicibacterium duvalii]PEG34704.1 anti-sigma regulatory factor [Mycolicibacterium duvalii]BBX16345.1 anti-sigma regulatory factor [Mycolicibacterium duvalii]